MSRVKDGWLTPVLQTFLSRLGKQQMKFIISSKLREQTRYSVCSYVHLPFMFVTSPSTFTDCTVKFQMLEMNETDNIGKFVYNAELKIVLLIEYFTIL
jgi:hypothetical protein